MAATGRRDIPLASTTVDFIVCFVDLIPDELYSVECKLPSVGQVIRIVFM
jgi:hypothetical protein